MNFITPCWYKSFWHQHIALFPVGLMLDSRGIHFLRGTHFSMTRCHHCCLVILMLISGECWLGHMTSPGARMHHPGTIRTSTTKWKYMEGGHCSDTHPFRNRWSGIVSSLASFNCLVCFSPFPRIPFRVDFHLVCAVCKCHQFHFHARCFESTVAETSFKIWYLSGEIVIRQVALVRFTYGGECSIYFFPLDLLTQPIIPIALETH